MKCSLLMVFPTFSMLTGLLGNLNKCCPGNHRFKYNGNTFECVLLDDDSMVGGDWWDFPQDTVLLVNNSLDNNWLSDVKVVEGHRPICAKDSSDVLVLTDTEQDFNLLREEDDNVMLQVLKDASRHDPGIAHEAHFPERDYCIDRAPGMFVALLCPCTTMQCVRKCCWDSEAFNEDTNRCEYVHDFPHQVYDWTPGVKNKTKDLIQYYRLTQKPPDCLQKAVHVIQHRLDEEAKLILLSDGSIQAVTTGRVYHADRYCGDFTVDNDEMLHYCLDAIADADAGANSDTLLHVYATIFLLSAASLFVTVVLTLIIPHMRGNVLTLMALMHNIALLVGFITMGIVQLTGHWLEHTTCICISFIIQFSFLASFFWLNAMCFDLSWLNSGLQQKLHSYRHNSRQRFVTYSLYAWGSTCLICMATAIVEFGVGFTAWKPDFGIDTCFFNNRRATWLFFYGPMATLLIIDLVLLTCTAWRTFSNLPKLTALLPFSLQQHTRLDVDEITNYQHKRKLILFVKLFTLMGASWIFEVISWAVDGHGAFWIVIDVINLLRGVFIFIIFCCNKAVYSSVKDKVQRMLLACGKSEMGRYLKTTNSRLELEELVNEDN